MESEHHSGRESRSKTHDRGQRVHDALTDLSAYALSLDSEYHRLDERLHELADAESPSEEVLEVVRERSELAAELKAYRGAITDLRDQVLGDR